MTTCSSPQHLPLNSDANAYRKLSRAIRDNCLSVQKGVHQINNRIAHLQLDQMRK
jgi:hypothetical protein